MATTRFRTVPRLEFSLGEVSGALGDSITVLPLVVAVGALSDLSIGTILFGFGLFQIFWGVYYGTPVSVEPMKALAALVIAGTLTSREFAVAGLLAGGILLAIGSTHTLERLQRTLGKPVIRGVQLAVALILVETGVRLGLGNLTSALVVVGVVLVLLWLGQGKIAPLIVLGLGGVVAIIDVGTPAFAMPALSSVLLTPEPLDVVTLFGATAGQLAMTVGNAAVATSLLLSEYYESEVSPDELAASMGAMNLLAVRLGMLPMCHGSGGVAAKYTFGAKTAGANVILGVVYLALALFATGIVMAFPLSLLGVVLVLIAVQLGRTSLETDQLWITLVVGVVSLVTNLGVGFIGGIGLYLLAERDIRG